MVSQELLAILRCPMNPGKSRLILNGEHLVCEHCALRFPIRDGFPVLVVEEAELPPGCANLAQLPCQLEGMASRAPLRDSEKNQSPTT